MFLVPVTRKPPNWPAASIASSTTPSSASSPPAAQAGSDAARSPALDVAESDRAYTVKLDMPGVAKDDVKISIDGRRISVEAQTRKEEAKKDGERIVYRERSMSSFARSFTLAAEVDQAASPPSSTTAC